DRHLARIAPGLGLERGGRKYRLSRCERVQEERSRGITRVEGFRSAVGLAAAAAGRRVRSGLWTHDSLERGLLATARQASDEHAGLERTTELEAILARTEAGETGAIEQAPGDVVQVNAARGALGQCAAHGHGPRLRRAARRQQAETHAVAR